MSALPLELEGVIGFSGTIKHSLILHPDDTHIIYPLGSTIVIKNVEDTNDQTFLQGHTDRVMCIAITRDGNTLASGQITHMGYLAEILLWDTEGLSDGRAPELLHRLRLHKVMVQALAFSCNGTYLASIGGPDDNNLVIWNVDTGCAICGSPAAHDACLTVKWMNNADNLLVTGGIKALRMWEVRDDTPRRATPCARCSGRRLHHGCLEDGRTTSPPLLSSATHAHARDGRVRAVLRMRASQPTAFALRRLPTLTLPLTTPVALAR